ncbi:MAG TPA: serine protease [Thermoanaerobaculia bacterium]|nr:serine protease [Thermoanaerobaculia bacterium]
MDRLSTRTQRPANRLLVALCCGVALLGSGALAWAAPPATDEAPQTFGLKDIRGSFKSGKPAPQTPSQRLGLDLVSVPEVRLAAPNLDRIFAEDKAAREVTGTKALRYGVGRDVQLSAVDGNWFDLADGAKLWVGDVASTDAIGLRLHLTSLNLPQGAEIAVYAPSELDARSRYLKTGEVSDPFIDFFRSGSALKADKGVWTSTVVGDRARIEYFVPAGAEGRNLPFTVDRLQHLYLDPVAAVTKSEWEKAAGPCHNDVTCFPEWGETAKAVAGIGAIGSNALFCTGQLLNNQKQDFTPYFLTANHCLESQGEAESVEIFWFYQTSTCGGAPPSLSSVPRSRGTSLLSTNSTSDYTLLLIEGAVPPGVTWAGWNAGKVNDGVDVTAIHHPRGDYKRISFGNKVSGTHFCGTSIINDGNHVKIDWSDAPTEPGSSGSGIFRNDTHQLFGQLHCGPSSCSSESNDSYGAFFLTYPRIKSYLVQGGSDDKTEQNDTCAKAKLAKPGTLGNRIVKVTDQDWFKVNVPRGKTATVRARFANGDGDIDLKAFGSCKGGAVATSEGDGDVEEIQVTNNGRKAAFVWVQVYLFNDVRNSYDLEVSVQ